VDIHERELLRRYLIDQFEILSRRHGPERAILVRVLSDHYREPVNLTNQGRFDKAEATLRALRGLIPPKPEEVRIACELAELPAAAFVAWRRGMPTLAIDRLKLALERARRLAEQHEHLYLTAKRIYLAANIARVLITDEQTRPALDLIEQLKAVVAGDRQSWPYRGKTSLDVPLHGLEHQALEGQLEKAEAAARKQPDAR
jgi:hypothetical protein